MRAWPSLLALVALVVFALVWSAERYGWWDLDRLILAIAIGLSLGFAAYLRSRGR